MDPTPFLHVKPIPRVVFDALPLRGEQPRFCVPAEGLGHGTDGWRTVTWNDFARLIRCAGLYLASAGVGSGDRVALFGANSVEWLSAALGAQVVGGVMVPIYPASTAEQAAYVVGHSEAKVLFVDGALFAERILPEWTAYAAVQRIVLFGDQVPSAQQLSQTLAALRAGGRAAPALETVQAKLVKLDEALAEGRRSEADAPGHFEQLLDRLSLDQPALMLYTSGTTGRPKGVPLTHRNLQINARDWIACSAPLLEAGDVDLLWLPMSHIFGFTEACLGNTLGFTSYLCDHASVVQKLPEVRPTVFLSVPSVWEKLAASGSPLRAATGGRLRFCLSGGAGLKRAVKERFLAEEMLLLEGYGLTETSPTLTLNRPGNFDFDSVGKALPSVEVKLAEDGEILARGPSVFSGYFKDEAATAAAFTDDGWFKTGDLGAFDHRGYLRIIDRKKDILVTSGGKNVPPANLELKFRDDPFIAHLVVYGDGKRYLVAGVWLNDTAVAAHLDRQGVPPQARAEATRALIAQRIDAVNAELASFETLKRFAVMSRPLTVAEGFLTATLKVRRRQVYAAFREDFERLYD